MAMNGDREYAIKDDAPVLEFYAAHKDDDSKTLSKAVLSNESFWGEDLSAYEGLTDKQSSLIESRPRVLTKYSRACNAYLNMYI